MNRSSINGGESRCKKVAVQVASHMASPCMVGNDSITATAIPFRINLWFTNVSKGFGTFFEITVLDFFKCSVYFFNNRNQTFGLTICIPMFFRDRTKKITPKLKRIFFFRYTASDFWQIANCLCDGNRARWSQGFRRSINSFTNTKNQDSMSCLRDAILFGSY